MMTIESWENFIRYYGGIVGARDCFELACDELLRLENPNKEVHRVKVSRGDGGIDIYVGDGDVVDIYQCKFFIDNLNPSRWRQIRESFKRILKLEKKQIASWYLCVPKEFTKEEIFEIEEFKCEFKEVQIFIKFIDGNELITRMNNVGIGEKWFSPIPKRILLSYYPKLIPEYVPREDIDELSDAILKTNLNYLITGIGGIGKTTVLEDLFIRLNEKYDVCIWIDYNTDLKTSFSAVLAERYDNQGELISALANHFNQKSNQRNIILIDNVSEDYFVDKMRFFIERSAQIVITSRLNSISGYKVFELKDNSDENMGRIFSEYYGNSITEEERKLILEIGRLYEGNVLLIEMIARAAKKSLLPLQEFIEMLIKKGITSTDIKIQNRRKAVYVNIKNNLKLLYDIEKISESKKEILANLSLMSDLGLSNGIFRLYNFSEEEVSDLIEYGWIQKKSERYYMHPLVRECIYNQIIPYKEYINSTKLIFINRDLYKDEMKIYEKKMLFDIILKFLKHNHFDTPEDVYILYNLILLTQTSHTNKVC